VISVYTNTTRRRLPRRGPARSNFVVERLMETAARQLKVDPAEFTPQELITAFPHRRR